MRKEISRERQTTQTGGGAQCLTGQAATAFGVALPSTFDVMSESSAPRLETGIRAHLRPWLRADGFAGSGRTFRRVRDDWVQVVNVQGSKWGGSFAINLAIHPLVLPDLRGNPPDPKKITQELCEFRRRLSEGNSDQWWKYEASDESMNTAVSAAAQVYIDYGRPLLERMSGPDVPMNTLFAADFAKGKFDFAGFGSTEVRMALALARLRRGQGRDVEAASFAAYGLTRLGGATALRRDLEQLAGES
jgi:hypothetical protein